VRRRVLYLGLFDLAGGVGALLVLPGLFDPFRDIVPVPEQTDPETGFVTGGKNSTELIRRLTRINGRTIAELEADMRPGAKADVGSTAGFLGQDEKLLEVLATDNAYVVDQLGLTHQELARHLRALVVLGKGTIPKGWGQRKGREFEYSGRRFQIEIRGPYGGSQLSPFYDGTSTNWEVTTWNLDNGKRLWWSLLVPDMIERYGFYEGKGTSYRVAPRDILELCDFIQPRKRAE
jgi:hypothetical protein